MKKRIMLVFLLSGRGQEWCVFVWVCALHRIFFTSISGLLGAKVVVLVEVGGRVAI